MMKPERKVLVIHGPNLNLLGLREPEIYGKTTLEEIDAGLKQRGQDLGILVETFQSNHEGALVDRIQQAAGRFDGIIINPAAFTHTSVAIRDALLFLNLPAIEVHLSNIHKREAFRRRSMITDIVTGQILGLGFQGYLLALEAMDRILSEPGGSRSGSAN